MSLRRPRTRGAARRALSTGVAGGAVAAVLITAFFFAPRARTGVNPDDTVIFFSGGDLGSLRYVLEAPESRLEIERLLVRLPLWTARVRTLPEAPPGATRSVVTLVFGLPVRYTTRVHEVSFVVETVEQEHAVIDTWERFGSLTLAQREPMAGDAAALDVLARAAGAASFVDALAAWLADGVGVSHMTVRRAGAATAPPGGFVVAVHRRGYAGAQGTESRHWAAWFGDVSEGFHIAELEDR